MSALNFVPEIWAKVILAALRKNLVYGGAAVCNADYEGEIAGPGDTVHITSFSDPTVGDYVEGTDITYGSVADASQTLLINQQKYAAFSVEDIDKRQAAGDFQSYLEGRMSYQLALTADQYLAALMFAGATTVLGNTTTNGDEVAVTLATSGTSASFYNEIVLPLSVALDDAEVPDDGNRFLIVPPFAQALLKQTPAFASFGVGDVLLKGALGQIDSFTVFKSLNVPTFDAGAGYAVIAGHPMATTFAEQIVSVEALRLQDLFADGVRALHVYGAKVVRPTALAVAGITRPAGI